MNSYLINNNHRIKKAGCILAVLAAFTLLTLTHLTAFADEEYVYYETWAEYQEAGGTADPLDLILIPFDISAMDQSFKGFFQFYGFSEILQFSVGITDNKDLHRLRGVLLKIMSTVDQPETLKHCPQCLAPVADGVFLIR